MRIAIEVRYFAAAREAAGTEVETVETTDGATVAVLTDRLTRSHPGLADLRARLRYAVGERFVSAEHPLTDGDVLALLPPVSGG